MNLEKAIAHVDRIQESADEDSWSRDDKIREKAYRKLAFVNGFWYALVILQKDLERERR